MPRLAAYPLRNSIVGTVRPGRLRRVWPGLPERAIDWWALCGEMRPRKLHWACGLPLAIALVLMWGEFGPAAGAVALLR